MNDFVVAKGQCLEGVQWLNQCFSDQRLSNANNIISYSMIYMYILTDHFLPSQNHYRSSQTRSILLALQLFLHNPKGHLQHIQLLFHMRPLQPRRHTSARISPRIHDMLMIMMLSLIQQRLYPRLCETPCSSIERLFLRPDNGFGIRVHVEVFFELRPWEGVELLDAGDGDGVEVVLFAVFVECDVCLAGAEDDAVNFFWCFDVA